MLSLTPLIKCHYLSLSVKERPILTLQTYYVCTYVGPCVHVHTYVGSYQQHLQIAHLCLAEVSQQLRPEDMHTHTYVHTRVGIEGEEGG